MKKNFTKTACARTLAVVLAAGMIVSSAPASLAKAKKPKLNTTKVSVTVGKTKKVTVKNAKKVTWSLTKAGKKIVSLSKKSKKGATIKGKKAGSATISVKMKSGKKTYKKSIKVTVKKAAIVTPKPTADNSTSTKPSASPTTSASTKPAAPTATPTVKPTNIPTNSPTNAPTSTPTSTPTSAPSATPTASAEPTATATVKPDPTATPMPTPELGENDISVKMNVDNAYASGSVSGVSYNENGAFYTASQESSGGGIAWYINEDKTPIDLSKFSKVKFIVSADTASAPVVMGLIKNETPTFWNPSTVGFTSYQQYAATSATANEEIALEFDLANVAEADKNASVYGIMLKYNAYDADGTGGFQPVKFNIRSIVLEGKEVVEPETTPEASPSTKPETPVTSGSAAIAVESVPAVSGSAATVKVGETVDVKAVVTVSGCAVSGSVVWASADAAIASVTGSGVTATITANAVGTTDITASITTDTGLEASAKFSVTVESGKLVLTGDDLGDKAAFTYVPNGAAQWSALATIELDPDVLSSSTPLLIKYTAVDKDGETDIASTTKINQIIRLGNKYNSTEVIGTVGYGKSGGTLTFNLTDAQITEIKESTTGVYAHISLSDLGFTGSYTTTSVKVGTEDAYKGSLDTYKYAFVESGLPQYGETAKVMLPTDMDFSAYSKVIIEYTSVTNDNTINLYGIIGNKVTGAPLPTTDVSYSPVNSIFTIPLKNIIGNGGLNPYITIGTLKAGFTGSVTITKITFEP